MKKDNQFLYSYLLIILLTFCMHDRVNAQEIDKDTLHFYTEIGTPVGFNIGTRIQFDQVQVGLGIGFIPDVNMTSFSGDIFYHFAGYSYLSKKRLWYARVGLNYTKFSSHITDEFLFLNTRIGKDFILSKKIGIAIDAGPVFKIFQKEMVNEFSSDNFNFSYFKPGVLSFSYGITLFYRLY